jgi:hypothetical protein
MENAMTVPRERTNAVMWTEQFLLQLTDSKQTPRVPKVVRDQARHLLRHYPTRYEMEIISSREDGDETHPQIKIFGRTYV